MTYREGDIVRVPGERGTAKIRAVLHHMNGVLLETAIGGFRRWNQDELKLVKRGKKKNSRRESMKVAIIVTALLCCAGSVQAQERRLASLAQQEMCANRAKRAFNESDASKKSKNTVTPPEYTSHYEPKANICYMMVFTTYTFDGGKNISIGINVYDAFEGRTYASYVWQSDKTKPLIEVRPQMCLVKPLGQDEIICKSQVEFTSLVEKHFGIGD